MCWFSPTIACCVFAVASTVAQPLSERARPNTFAQTKPLVGDLAPDFVLHDLNGKEARLSEWRGRRPVVIEFGSYT